MSGPNTKVAVVTGGSSGLGRAISIAFAKQQWKVIVADMSAGAPEGDLRTTVEVIKSMGNDNVAFILTDVSDSESIQALVAKTVLLYGRIDVLVNNAGISLESQLGPKYVHETDESTFDKTLAVNARSVMLGSKYAIRQFLKQEPLVPNHRGWIINIASVYGLQSELGHISYCASKAAVVHMTKCIAREYGPSKIHCNVICPGFVKTGMDSKLYADEQQAVAAVSLHPWGTLGCPEDIAKVAVFLAGDEASWITGVALPVDGGYMTA